MSENKEVPFSKIIEALLDATTPFPPRFLYRFSDITDHDLAMLKIAWPKIQPIRREALLEDLEDLAEADTLLCFDDLAIHALDDEDPGVREHAITLLWESEDGTLASRFIQLLENDPVEKVRATAAAALGQFVYLGELEQIPAATSRKVEESLLDQFTKNETKLIRRKALESLGYSGRDEVSVLIENALTTNEKEWMSSALCAMGRSADLRWEPYIQKMIHHSQPEVQEEAIRAAGGLELASTREPLLDLLEEKDVLDDDVYAALIWALSQIGGNNVREALEKLADEAEDDSEIEYIESALENLEFSENFGEMDFLNVDLDSDESSDQTVDKPDEDIE